MFKRRDIALKNVLFFIIGCTVAFILLSFNRCSRANKEEELSLNRPSYSLVLLIISAPSNVGQRNAIRETWLNLRSKNVGYYFVVGSAVTTHSQVEDLVQEYSIHKDVLHLFDLKESYNQLTRKVLEAFVWLNKNVNFQYVLKCDDDSFVVIDKIEQELQNSLRQNNLYWGFFNGHATVKRRGKWREADWVLCDNYLPYALGGGYVLSSRLVQFIASNAEYLQLYNSEDVSVGTWLAPASVHRQHDPRFDTEFISRGCSNEYLVLHKQSESDMRQKFDTLQTTGNICSAEYKVRNSYMYNWKVPPSRCCIRNDSSIP